MKVAQGNQGRLLQLLYGAKGLFRIVEIRAAFNLLAEAQMIDAFGRRPAVQGAGPFDGNPSEQLQGAVFFMGFQHHQRRAGIENQVEIVSVIHGRQT